MTIVHMRTQWHNLAVEDADRIKKDSIFLLNLLKKYNYIYKRFYFVTIIYINYKL